ncbi:MAG: MBL fold metallo-hydrolase [Actinobacteria bacterium]|nr:MBL fold metallo-hydrolase [Actinomycetota bacterium]
MRAENPGPMTLSGTNSYLVVDRGEVWVVDPGPADIRHIHALAAAVRRLGEPAGVALTHDHGDHSEGVEPLREELGEPPLLRFGALLVDSPLTAVHTPGHAADHLVFTLGDVLFSGDLILGGSSTIVPPGGGTLIAYLESLRVVEALEPRLILPGHGEPIEDAANAVARQLEHRAAREAGLLAALSDGLREREVLLDRVWADVPPALRLAAHVTMQSHLEKLDLEGRLVEDFEPEGRRHWGHLSADTG